MVEEIYRSSCCQGAATSRPTFKWKKLNFLLVSGARQTSPVGALATSILPLEVSPTGCRRFTDFSRGFLEGVLAATCLSVSLEVTAAAAAAARRSRRPAQVGGREADGNHWLLPARPTVESAVFQGLLG